MQPDPSDIYEARRQQDEDRKNKEVEWREKAEAALLTGSSFDGVDADRVAEDICLIPRLGYLLIEAERSGEWWRIAKMVRQCIKDEIDAVEKRIKEAA